MSEALKTREEVKWRRTVTERAWDRIEAKKLINQYGKSRNTEWLKRYRWGACHESKSKRI